MTNKLCRACEKILPASAFYALPDGRLRHPCKACNSQKERDRYLLAAPEKARAYREHNRWLTLKSKYGITKEQYESLRLSQRDRCAICRKVPDGNFDVDHCHETGKIRSLLCRQCNAGLGLFYDSIVLLKMASEYLLKHRPRQAEEMPEEFEGDDFIPQEGIAS